MKANFIPSRCFRAEKSMNVVARWDFCGHFPLEFRLFSRFTNVSAPFKMSRSVTSIESKDPQCPKLKMNEKK